MRKKNNLIKLLANSVIKKLPDRMRLKIKPILELKKKMDYKNQDIYLNIDSEIEYDFRLRSCEKEPETVAWIETFLKAGEVFYDIGANVGAYSLVAAKYHQGKVKVYAFEPSCMNYIQLCKNIFINQCQDIIIPLQTAFNDKTTLEVFNYENLVSGGALHSLGKPVDYKGRDFSPVLRQTVMAYSLDDLVRLFGAPVPNHIKIDVDGIEYKILKGAEKTLQNPALGSIFIEIEEENKEIGEIVAYVEKFGFSLKSSYRNRFIEARKNLESSHNFIFRRNGGRNEKS